MQFKEVIVMVKWCHELPMAIKSKEEWHRKDREKKNWWKNKNKIMRGKMLYNFAYKAKRKKSVEKRGGSKMHTCIFNELHRNNFQWKEKISWNYTLNFVCEALMFAHGAQCLHIKYSLCILHSLTETHDDEWMDGWI